MHDDDYDRGGSGADRKEADKSLYLRMLKLIHSKGGNPWKMTWLVLIALLYYAAIRIFGRFYFNYDKKDGL